LLETCKPGVVSEGELVKATVQNWIWSWSDSRCETEEEFLLSKALFLKFIASNQVQKALGPQGIEQLEDFYCKCIEHHEDLFVFYQQHPTLTAHTKVPIMVLNTTPHQ
jgi:hypothetical protein